MNSEIKNINKLHQGPILVAADFSENSKTAVVWAIDIAIALQASLVLIHIVHDRAEGPGYYRHDKEDAMRPMEDIAEKNDAEISEKLK
jgi:nucleotide-binding universal stress UspA family protein